MYIVIEGQDGTGKSTQAKLLADHFRAQGKTVVLMNEPDGDLPQAHDLHDLILIKGKDYNLEGLTNVLLFTASRLELWNKIAQPVLRDGGVVVSARNWWSTLAYQGYGENVSRAKIIQLTKDLLPAEYVTPTHSVILTIPDQLRLDRQAERGKSKETFEAKPDDFQQRVNKAYLEIAREFNIPIIDASGTIEEINAKLKKLFSI